MSEIEHTETTPRYVVPFDDERATDRSLVGGKGANVARLVAAGLPVPPGFCVTTRVYERLIDDPAIRERIHDLSAIDPADTTALADAGAALRARVEGAEIPTEVRGAIETALDATASGSERAYAVRSSATAEDRPEASFAGQQETYLNVRGADEVVERVRDCMASLFTDRAIAYRARNGVPHEDVAIGVVVQRMVSPDVSGILFTADPTTGNRFVASIDAGRGLGEALVSGLAAGDEVRVDTRTGEILEYEVGDQRVAVRSLPEGGTETIELAPADRAERVLTDEQVRSLVGLGTRIEALFGCPQDVEWCLADGEFSVVQARPITSLFPVPSPPPADDRLHVYYSMGHAQAFGEAMPPLVRDVWLAYIRTSMAEWGLAPDANWATEAGGRIYIDLTPLLRVGPLRRRLPTQLASMSEAVGAAVADVLERRGEEFERERTAGETLATALRLTRTVSTGARMGFPVTSSMVDGLLGAFVGAPNPPEYEEARWTAWGRTVAAEVRAPDTLDARVRAVFAFSAGTTDFPAIGPLYAALLAGGWLGWRFPDESDAVHGTEVPVGQSEPFDGSDDVNAVGRGFPHELVTRINLGLGDLADVARDHPAVVEALREGAPIEEIESVEGGTAFRSAFDAYLDEFGHRATGEIDVSRPRWREDPSGLLAAVRANLEHGERGEHREHLRRLEREAHAAAERLERRADRGFSGPVRRRIVRRVIRTYRGYIQTREYPKHGLAHAFSAWREVLLEAGATLVADGRLADADDVWFLRREELFAALEGAPLEVDVAARRAEFERHAAMDAPAVVTSEGEIPSGRTDPDVPDGVLVGTGVSGGVVEGIARVVRDPAEETIERGEILVAPSSDPGWTPLFLNAAGMVVEVGTRMSHGAIVAREYGLPAVVSVPGATRRIETGQRVRLDGTRGTIEIVDEG
ncbi:PEP/pyruvate-binding domain-containing protein [Halalkalicoccus sp. NIPERK01]|uniref:PEP/pyruvate-binding domain-containing protein n=1 Tax=Halalkalicoccus sp. NIPERK01 TaxID=3053469 RepID=UPI00256EF8C0|nr:PEP/pyruvate-binding domain-containing protein [Halalkalicoccus sp. NIPERK01]MDL5360474.1 PEP/pyruvate-binding domain-containing protein [Halalkalicoccus sp. NIPERK01]